MVVNVCRAAFKATYITKLCPNAVVPTQSNKNKSRKNKCKRTTKEGRPV